MALRVVCPQGHVLQVKDECAGKAGLCPHCHSRVQVPAARALSDDDVVSLLDSAGGEAKRPVPAAAQPAPRRVTGPQPAAVKAPVAVETPPNQPAKVCLTCCDTVSAALAACPRCGAAVGAWTVAPFDQQRHTVRATCHHLGVRKQGEATIVRFGDHEILDESSVAKIGDELYSVAGRRDCRNLVLNFSGVTRLTSVMLGVMLMLKRRMEAQGGRLSLCLVGDEIRDVFSATQLGRTFAVYRNELSAIKADGPPEQPLRPAVAAGRALTA